MHKIEVIWFQFTLDAFVFVFIKITYFESFSGGTSDFNSLLHACMCLSIQC